MRISRRRFLRTTLTASTTGLLVNGKAVAAAAPARDLIVLESDAMLVVIDPVTRCIDRIESKHHAWQMRGGGMRLHVPAPYHRYHYLSEHHAAKPHIDPDGTQVTIRCSGFESERMGKLDISVKETVRLAGNAVQFSYEIRSGSPAVIESYTYPRLAGLKPPAGEMHTRQAAWSYSGMGSLSLWPAFGNHVGYYGYDTPAQLRHLGTDIHFRLVLSDTRGLYLGYHDHGQKQTVQVCFFFAPAYVDSFNSSPVYADRIVDSAIGIDPNHLCFTQPGASQTSEAFVMESFTGAWQAGADIYKAWRASWFKRPQMPRWVEEVHSWQQIQINSSEDRLEFPHKDLTRVAEACRRWGVKAIQLTGGQIGGQDRDFPLHDTDPRLGTAEEFKAAFAASKRNGR